MEKSKSQQDNLQKSISSASSKPKQKRKRYSDCLAEYHSAKQRLIDAMSKTGTSFTPSATNEYINSLYDNYEIVICKPMDCSLPGSSVHGILQVGILEWVAMTSREEEG